LFLLPVLTVVLFNLFGFQAFAKMFNSTPDDLDMQVIYDVSHNIAKFEEHYLDGKQRTLLVHRKGLILEVETNNGKENKRLTSSFMHYLRSSNFEVSDKKPIYLLFIFVFNCIYIQMLLLPWRKQ
jgi:hypothetical protein